MFKRLKEHQQKDLMETIHKYHMSISKMFHNITLSAFWMKCDQIFWAKISYFSVVVTQVAKGFQNIAKFWDTFSLK